MVHFPERRCDRVRDDEPETFSRLSIRNHQVEDRAIIRWTVELFRRKTIIREPAPHFRVRDDLTYQALVFGVLENDFQLVAAAAAGGGSEARNRARQRREKSPCFTPQ